MNSLKPFMNSRYSPVARNTCFPTTLPTNSPLHINTSTSTQSSHIQPTKPDNHNVQSILVISAQGNREIYHQAYIPNSNSNSNSKTLTLLTIPSNPTPNPSSTHDNIPRAELHPPHRRGPQSDRPLRTNPDAHKVRQPTGSRLFSLGIHNP
jgi:hypothetical protein